jgi:glycosyltransferase involved in cell wall biosynthesis
MFRSSSVNRSYYVRHFRYYLGKLLGELDYYERLKPHIHQLDKNTSHFYTYWFEHSLLAVCLLKEEGHIRHVVSRAHGFDLYDDRNQDRPIPFREYKLQQLDAVYCISGHGLKYLKDKVATTFHPKIQLSYLGVKTPVLLPKESQNQIPVLVSVSSLVDFKRVGLIAQALKHYESPLKWIHFGSGPLWNEIKSQVAALPNNIQVELKGHVENEDVLNFYSCNHVDMFISSSESEGLPVSMMEAQSFNIPILSCNVGGISEIVINEKTGILLPVKIEPEALATQIQNTLNLSFKKSEIQKHFELNFEATHNYRLFCKKILKIG